MMVAPIKSSPLKPSRLLAVIGIALLIACVGFLLLLNAWSSSQVIVAFHSLLAFLAITCSASILIQYRLREHAEQTVFHAALFFAAIINIGRAISIIYDNSLVYEYGIVQLLKDLLFLAVFSSLVLAAVVMKRKKWIENRRRNVMILILSGVFVHLSLSYLIISILPSNSFIILGTILGVYSGAILISSGAIWSLIPGGSSTYDLNLLIAGFAVYGSSWIPFVLVLYYPSTAWSLSYILWSLGLVILNLGSSVPFQIRTGMKPSRAYLLPLGISLLVILPTGVTITTETYLAIPPTTSIPLFVVFHIGASLIALLMALLMYLYNNQRPSQKRQPIISLFIAWTTIEAYQVVKVILIPPDALELSIIPYVIGSIYLAINLLFAIRWTSVVPEIPQDVTKKYILIVPAVFLTVILSEYIEIVVYGYEGAWGFQPFGRALLLISTLMSMFGFVYYSSLQIKEGKGRITVDILTVGILALWIIPSLIKANFREWTIGWWSSEVILILVVLMGPSVLGLLYLREMNRAEESHKRATLLADLLVHDISNYHQALAFSIGLLEMDDAGPLAKAQAIRDSKSELQRADQLIRNVRRLGMADELTSERLVAIDLIQILQEAFQLASRKSDWQEIRFKINYEFETCFVLANDLLLDVFLNIFDNSIKYSKDAPEIEVEISEIAQNNMPYWNVRVSDHAKGIDPKKRVRMFERYMKDATGTGLGLSVTSAIIQAFGGSIRVDERVPGSYYEGTTFTILLKKARENPLTP